MLGLASLAFGVYEFARPRRWAEMAEVQPELVQALGVRDAAVGLALTVARDPRPALLARIVCDVGDGYLFARKSRILSVAAFAFAALGARQLRAG